MLKLFSTTALALILAAPVWAQEAGDASGTEGGGKQSNILSTEDETGRTNVNTDPAVDDIDRAAYPFLGAQDERSWNTSRLIGKAVQTASGETIGEVKDVILTQDDRIVGVVVDAGDYLGSDTREVAVDWHAVSVPADQDVLVVELSRDQLEGAPEYKASETWRMHKEARSSLTDIEESQPGVIAGEDPTREEDQPDAGAGSTESGAENTTGGTSQ